MTGSRAAPNEPESGLVESPGMKKTRLKLVGILLLFFFFSDFFSRGDQMAIVGWNRASTADLDLLIPKG